jgi:hypothetical protein
MMSPSNDELDRVEPARSESAFPVLRRADYKAEVDSAVPAAYIS